MRQPKVRSMLDHPSGQTNVTSLQSVRQSQDILLHLIAVVDDRIGHRRMLTNLLTVSSFEVPRRTGSASGAIHLSGRVTSEIRKSWPVHFRFIPTCRLRRHTPPINRQKAHASGLFVGCDIPSVDRAAYSLLKNPLIILPYIKEVFNIEESN